MALRGEAHADGLALIGESSGSGRSATAGGGGAGPYGEAAGAAVAELTAIEGEVASLEGRANQLRARADSLRALLAVLDELGAGQARCADRVASFVPSAQFSLAPLPVRVSTTSHSASNGRLAAHRRV